MQTLAQLWHEFSNCHYISRVCCSRQQHGVVRGSNGQRDRAPSDLTAARRLRRRHPRLPATVDARYCQRSAVVVHCLRKNRDACKDTKEEFKARNHSRILQSYSNEIKFAFATPGFFGLLHYSDCFLLPSRSKKIGRQLQLLWELETVACAAAVGGLVPAEGVAVMPMMPLRARLVNFPHF